MPRIHGFSTNLSVVSFYATDTQSWHEIIQLGLKIFLIIAKPFVHISVSVASCKATIVLISVIFAGISIFKAS
jgi:hypothetical protein